MPTFDIQNLRDVYRNSLFKNKKLPSAESELKFLFAHNMHFDIQLSMIGPNWVEQLAPSTARSITQRAIFSQGYTQVLIEKQDPLGPVILDANYCE